MANKETPSKPKIPRGNAMLIRERNVSLTQARNSRKRIEGWIADETARHNAKLMEHRKMLSDANDRITEHELEIARLSAPPEDATPQ